MSTINELLDEFDEPLFTEAEFLRERAELLKRFLMDYAIVSAEDIDARIRSGEINDGNDLVERWLSLREAERHLNLDRPPKRRYTGAEQTASRDERGSFYFRDPISLRATRLYCARWMRSMRSSWRRRKPTSTPNSRAF